MQKKSFFDIEKMKKYLKCPALITRIKYMEMTKPYFVFIRKKFPM